MTAMFTNRLEAIPGNFQRSALSAEFEPTPDQRQALEVRRDEIDTGLNGCDPDAVDRAVGMLRTVMASANASQEALSVVRTAFNAVLVRFPQWAVEEACLRFLDGRSGNKVYAPSPAEIADLCRTLIAGALSERAKINAILDAEVYRVPSEEERAEVARRYEVFLAETARAAQGRDSREVEGHAMSLERAAENRALAARLAVAEAERKAKIAERAA